ncbi:hypothetical protein CR492_13310 [Methylocella silvestris]|uniref:Uncharacterized protein n=1 Tax=Methylocella silvestris TaxID=199596 RepID=A0A2J7TFG1_METSI|nr:hypothetical protein CR492_13310 [Methylocella silvestris]
MTDKKSLHVNKLEHVLIVQMIPSERDMLRARRFYSVQLNLTLARDGRKTKVRPPKPNLGLWPAGVSRRSAAARVRSKDHAGLAETEASIISVFKSPHFVY